MNFKRGSLILSRRKDEGFVIGDGDQAIRVYVAEIRGDKVRLGVQADRAIPVLRDEIWLTVNQEPGDIGGEGGTE